MRTSRLRWIPAALATALLLAVPGAPVAEEEPPGGYKMTTYVVGFLKKGPAWTGEPSPELDDLQRRHLAHIGTMAESGKLILAGPFIDGGDLRGLLVFKLDGDTPQEMIARAEELARQDPMVQVGHLRLEFLPWYSAEGIGIDQEMQKR